MCEIPPIRMLVLTLTGRCNFKCLYCYASEQDPVDMTEETAIAAVALAHVSKNQFLLQFSGGEPLLQFPLIRKVVDFVEKNHVNAQMQIQTNGALLTKDIGKWLFDHHVGIGISCDGRPELMNSLRVSKDGDRSSQKVIQAFQNLGESNIEAGITCVVTDDTVEQLDGIVDMAYFYGNVHQIGFDILREQGRGKGLRAPTAEQMEKALERTAKKMDMLEEITGKYIHFTQEDRVRMLQRTGKYEFPQCFAMNGEAAFVDVHGDIYACSSLMGKSEYKLGNVYTGRCPENARKVGTFIRNSMKACRMCECFSLCGGGCFSRWLNKKGQVRRLEAECALKRFFIKRYLKRQEKAI